MHDLGETMERMRLSAWRFAPDPFESGELQGYFEPDRDDSLWTPIQVPCIFDLCLPSLASYEGTGWFRCRTKVPPEWSERRVVVRFGAVNYHAKVWVNGHLAGENRDGFLPFEVPLDRSQLESGELVVAVRADNWRRMGEVPGMERGWRPFGGILREVELVADDPLRIEAMGIMAEPDGRFQASLEVVNGRDAAVVALLRFTVADRDGRNLAEVWSPPPPPPPQPGRVRATRAVNPIQREQRRIAILLFILILLPKNPLRDPPSSRMRRAAG
jgi:beta-galactosidase/beta-glucuronidase